MFLHNISKLTMANCPKILPPLAAPKSTFLYVQLGSWPVPAAILVCERYTIKCFLPLRDRRALTIAARALHDISLPVTKMCIRFMETTRPWPWSTHHVQAVLTQLTTGYSFRLTARHKGIENVEHPSTLRIHFPYFHRAYKLSMQEKCYTRK